MSWLLLAAVQLALVIIQRVELDNYSSLIASHMPTLDDPEKSNWVMVQFHWTAIRIPAVAQLFLIPALFISVSRTNLANAWKWIAGIAAVLLALLAWYNSLVAFACTVATFD
ncbi:MAG: hypothetical protein ACR2NP_12200 [Pirellulaceae bacterium]